MRLWLIALALVLTAPLHTGPVQAQEQAQEPRIAPDGSWRVVELDGRPLDAADGVSMTFTAGRANGSAGCNRFSGGYSLMPGFTFDGIGTTRMACAGRAAEVEAAFVSALGRVNDWRPEGENGLALLTDGRTLVRAVLER